MMKKILQIFIWLLAGTYLVGVLGFIENEYDGVLCKDVKVCIRDSLEIRFIDSEKVKQLIMNERPEIIGIPLAQLNARHMEELLCAEQAVKNAQVYKTIEGSLVVDVSQRKPVILTGI